MTERPPPRRLQLRRSKGWRLPEGAVSVARPNAWGNPFWIGDPGPRTGDPITREQATALFRGWIRERGLEEQVRRELAATDLACWCAAHRPCHADVLLEIANSRAEARSAASVRFGRGRRHHRRLRAPGPGVDRAPWRGDRRFRPAAP
ncbi:MAG: DUF4326 domain-containing protein [Acidimicrobiales bacterium]